MSGYDELRAELRKHAESHTDDPAARRMLTEAGAVIHDLASYWGPRDKPVVETVEGLDALPVESIVLEHDVGAFSRTVWQKVHAGWFGLGMIDTEWPSAQIKLPALVLWTPGEA